MQRKFAIVPALAAAFLAVVPVTAASASAVQHQVRASYELPAESFAAHQLRQAPARTHHTFEHGHRLPAYCPGSGIFHWTCQAFRVLEEVGQSGRSLSASAVAIIAQHESSDNPAAVNNWDSNAQAGHPSEGLMQTIGSTFQAFCLPHYCGSMLNPVDDIIASTRYADSRYGSLNSVPGVVSVRSGGSYTGY